MITLDANSVKGKEIKGIGSQIYLDIHPDRRLLNQCHRSMLTDSGVYRAKRRLLGEMVKTHILMKHLFSKHLMADMLLQIIQIYLGQEIMMSICSRPIHMET